MIDELSKLAQFEASSVIDKNNKLFSFDEIADKLNLLITTASDAIKYQDYFSELPKQIFNDVQGTLQRLLNTLNEIASNKDRREWITANYSGKCDQVSQLYDELYINFVRGIREYVNSQSAIQKETREQLKRLREANTQAIETNAKTDTLVKIAGEATSELSAVEISQHFEDEVKKMQDDLVNIKSINWPKRFSWFRTFWRNWVSASGYDVSAGRWFILTLIAIAATSWLAYNELHSVDLNKVTVNTVVAKGLLLLAPAYAIRFCVRNFNANKHMMVVNRQRAVIMKTLLALMAHPGITDPTREQSIVAAVNRVFAISESGYITLRDGAGKNGGDEPVLDMSVFTKTPTSSL